MTNIVEEDRVHSHLPDYAVDFESDDMVIFKNRGTIARIATREKERIEAAISGDGFEEARLVAPGWDVYYLEQEWRGWMTEAPRDADAAFVGFCRKWFERRGRPA